jgi:mono/diheme cytochrome c family protein
MNRRDAGARIFPVLRFENFVIAAFIVLAAVASWKIQLRNVQAAEASPRGNHPGRRVYDLNCAVCHGGQGDGKGPAASMFLTRPRDFRLGVFKFRSTPSGSLPADQDLFQTVTHGLRWTAMIGRPDLSESDRIAVVDYIKTFSPRFATVKPAPSISVPPQPERTSALVIQGKELFHDAGCVSCHGEQGRGDGSSAPEMKDDWGWPIRPGDLTWRPLKRGSALDQPISQLSPDYRERRCRLIATRSARTKCGRLFITWNRSYRRSAGSHRAASWVRNSRGEWLCIWAE